MSSTSNASCSQYLHHVVQNSKRTTLPLIDALLNWSPAVVLARNRGAGCPVSSLAKAHAAAIARASGNRRRISEDLTSMGRNISTSPLKSGLVAADSTNEGNPHDQVRKLCQPISANRSTGSRAPKFTPKLGTSEGSSPRKRYCSDKQWRASGARDCRNFSADRKRSECRRFASQEIADKRGRRALDKVASGFGKRPRETRIEAGLRVEFRGLSRLSNP